MIKNKFKSVAILAASAAFVGLAGCNSMAGTTNVNLPMQYQERHPITVEAVSAEMEILVSPQSVALLRVDETRLRAFAAAYRTRGHGPLVLSVPSETPNSMAATQVAADVHRVLTQEGLHPDTVQSRPYRTNDNPSWAPLVLSFTRYTAEASPCGDWSESYSSRYNGNATPNFGCATQNNLAAMVSEPADLVQPRTMSPADAAQRANVLDNYRNARDTNTQRGDNASGAVADVQ